MSLFQDKVKRQLVSGSFFQKAGSPLQLFFFHILSLYDLLDVIFMKCFLFMSTLNQFRPSNFLFISFKNLLGGPTSWASLCKLGKSRFSHSNDYEESLLKQLWVPLKS